MAPPPQVIDLVQRFDRNRDACRSPHYNETQVRRPGIAPPPPAKLPSKCWRDLILRVWHVDPLRCPVCQSPMRVLALIDDPRVVEKILRHLGAWHDPPAGLSPPGATGPYTYEPCWDVGPMPDYGNVLTG